MGTFQCATVHSFGLSLPVSALVPSSPSLWLAASLHHSPPLDAESPGFMLASYALPCNGRSPLLTGVKFSRPARVATACSRAFTRLRVQVRVLCRSREQAAAAAAVPWLEEVTLDFLGVHGLKAAVAEVQAAGKRCAVALPRIAKPGEQNIWKFYLGLHADALLVRSPGLLHSLTALRDRAAAEAAGGDGDGDAARPVPPLYGDFSLNAANSVAAATLLRSGLARLTPTHDLNAAQLAALARALPPPAAARLEAVAHQHLPIFHTEHCVYARFLSDGNSRDDCGHPCESATVHLRDSGGADHLVLADMGCRNTVFNAQAQTALPHVRSLADAGIRCASAARARRVISHACAALCAAHSVPSTQRSQHAPVCSPCGIVAV